MIDKICEFLTNKIRKEMPEIDDERAEVINYGLQNIIGEIPKLFITLAIALIFGIFDLAFYTFLLIFPYKSFSGGFHLKTHIGCILMTSFYYCGIAYISRFQLFNENIKYIVIPLIWVFGMIMCKLYAPADTEYVPILRKKDRRIKQILSYITLTVTLVIGLIIKNYVVSNIIVLGMLAQSFTISKLAYRLTNTKYGYEVYLQENQVNEIG